MDHIDNTFCLNSLKAKRPKLSGECLDITNDGVTSIPLLPHCDNVLVDTSSYDRISIDSELGNEGMVISQTELTCDMGYGSLSAPLGDLGDTADTATEQTTQYGSMSQWDRCRQNQDDELEDLLYHFSEYFQRQFETELRSFQEKMYTILEIQQQHIRRIVYKCNPRPQAATLCDGGLRLNTEIVINPSTQEQAGAAPSSMPRVSYADTNVNTCITLPKREPQSGTTASQMLELMRLSAACTTVLSKPQFLTDTSKST